MALPRKWNTDLALVAIDGEVPRGTKVWLHADRDLLIGRTSKGLQVPDPLVSIQHAKITFDARRGYVIEDLGSATGTWIDEECIKSASRPIGVGTRLRVGDTVFEVRNRQRYPLLVQLAMAVALLLGVVALGLTAFSSLRSDPPPVLIWKDEVRQCLGELPSSRVPVPESFLRTHGIDIRRLQILKVTDKDYDGLNELWLRHDDREYVVTFDSEDCGRWRLLGEMPQGCVEMEQAAVGDGFPLLDCRGTRFVKDERYQLFGHEGVVVFVRPPPTSADPAARGEAHDGGAPEEPERPSRGDHTAVEPMRVVLKGGERLTGFLADRGVTEPVHYLICEDAFPGLRAQVLTGGGSYRQLGFGCLNGVRLSDDTVGRVVAVAFTATGQQVLIDDVRTAVAGNPDALFAPPEHRELLASLGADPGVLRGGVQLSFDGLPGFGEAIAQESVGIPRGRRPIYSGTRPEYAPVAVTASLVSPGLVEIDPPGCSVLRVRTSPFRYRILRGCMPRDPVFLRVEEVGCGEPRQVLTSTYFGGVLDARVEDLELRAVVDTVQRGDRVEVLRARLSYRTRPR